MTLYFIIVSYYLLPTECFMIYFNVVDYNSQYSAANDENKHKTLQTSHSHHILLSKLCSTYEDQNLNFGIFVYIFKL